VILASNKMYECKTIREKIKELENSENMLLELRVCCRKHALKSENNYRNFEDIAP